MLVKAWLDAQTGAEDVFNVWETSIRVRPYPRDSYAGSLAIKQHWNTTQHLSVSLLATLLNLLSTHFIYHSPGYAILKTLLSPTWVRRLNTGVGAGQNDLVLATMKLWSAMSEFGGGRERATIVKSFNWSFKVRVGPTCCVTLLNCERNDRLCRGSSRCGARARRRRTCRTRCTSRTSARCTCCSFSPSSTLRRRRRSSLHFWKSIAMRSGPSSEA